MPEGAGALKKTRHGSPDQAGSKLDALYQRPGFLIRRANQIAVWLFLDELAPRTITTTQYGALVILRDHRDIDQIGLSKLLCIDKSTTALVVGKLEAAGYMLRATDPLDRRRNVLRITPAGVQALRDMVTPAERSRQRLLSVFSNGQAQHFLRLLEHYVGTHAGDLPKAASASDALGGDAEE